MTFCYHYRVMLKAKLFKVKREYLEEWKEWCRELQNERLEEVKETLAEEELLQEAAFLLTHDNQFYVLGFMEGEGFPANMERNINKIHKGKKEKCLEYVGPAEILYHIKQ